MKRVIEDLVIKSHRTDRKIKDRHCEGSCYQNGEFTIFELEQTKRWFDLDHFPLEEGCRIINSEGAQFVVTKVDYKAKRPKNAICHTVRKTA